MKIKQEYRFLESDFEPGILYLEDIERIYGRKFTSDECKKLEDNKHRWLPYDLWSIYNLVYTWLNDHHKVKMDINNILFHNKVDRLKTYEPNDEVLNVK